VDADPQPGFVPTRYDTGFIRNSGPLFERPEGKGVLLGLRVLDHHLNPVGLAHGGLLATMADVAMAYNAQLHAGGFWISLGLTTQYLDAAGEGDWLEISATIPKAGKTTAYARAEVRRGETVLMTATGIFRRWDPPPPQG